MGDNLDIQKISFTETWDHQFHPGGVTGPLTINNEKIGAHFGSIYTKIGMI